MSVPDDALLRAATDVADGAHPDWRSLQRASGMPAAPTVAALRTIAAIHAAHDTLTAGALDAPATPPLEPGDTWAGLRILGTLGAGRFGDVYRAMDPSLDREVALKILRSAGPADEAEIVEEGRLAARVRHPNVITVYGAKREDGRTGVWMELVRGRTLEAELAERGPLSGADLTKVATELAGALSAVHGAGLIHRDVKTTNVMRDESGRVVLGDFGTGRFDDTADSAQAGLVGTPQYLAPEIFDGQPATPISDLYSLGVLLFRLATGRFPIEGRSLGALRMAHARECQPLLVTLRRDLPRPLARTIDRLLAQNPEHRFASAKALKQALGAAPRSRVILATTGVATVAVIVALVLLWNRPAGDPGGFEIDYLNPDFQLSFALRGPAIDDRRIPCAPRGSQPVAICDIQAGALVAELRQPPSLNAQAARDAWPSPDGQQLAYVWSGGTLGIINVDGTNPRDVYTGSAIRIVRWVTTDAGEALIIEDDAGPEDARALRKVNLTNGSVVDLWTFNGREDIRPDVSPDLRTIVVSRRVADDDLDVVAIDSVSHELLWRVPQPGLDRAPRWSPDGQSVVFASDLTHQSLMVLQLADRQLTGSIVPVPIAGASNLAPVGFGRDGWFYFEVFPEFRTSWIVELDSHLSASRNKLPVPPHARVDTMGADWSPSGRNLSYLQGSFGSDVQRGYVTVTDVTYESHRSVMLPGVLLNIGPTTRWSRSGQTLAVLYSEAQGSPWVLATMDVESGVVTPLVRADTEETISSPAWAPDDASIYYRWRRPNRDGPGATTGISRVFLASHTVEEVVTAPRGNIAYMDVAPDGTIAMTVSRPSLAVVRDGQGPLQCVVQFLRPGAPYEAATDRSVLDSTCTAIAWSRDGSRLAVATQTGPAANQDYGLWLLNRDAGAREKLAIEGLSRVWNVAFSADGNRLVFTDGNWPRSMWRVKGLPGPVRQSPEERR